MLSLFTAHFAASLDLANNMKYVVGGKTVAMPTDVSETAVKDQSSSTFIDACNLPFHDFDRFIVVAITRRTELNVARSTSNIAQLNKPNTSLLHPLRLSGDEAQ